MVVLDPKVKKIVTYASIGSLLILFLLINIGIFVFSRNLSREKLGSLLFDRLRKKEIVKIVPPTPSPSPTPTPKPIPTGKQTFSVSSGKKTGPQFRSGSIDPYDPKKGSDQALTIKIMSAKPVTKATLTMNTDHASKVIPMAITEGTATDGSWTARWKPDDTYFYIYIAKFVATDGTEENNVELTLR